MFSASGAGYEPLRVNDRAGVLTLADWAGIIECLNLESEKLPIRAEVSSDGSHVAADRRRSGVTDAERDTNRHLTRLEERLQGTRRSQFHQGHHSGSCKHIGEVVLNR